ncbi:MAG: hypothetical protein CBD74_13445 [Saprospirales bacterium TMED214]|nr:MAG: hypothetical protein CBD74_13445 [Saprospirales bacterium TMED214]
MFGITERNLGNQLLPISNGCQEISLNRVVTQRTLAELAETFPWKGQYAKPSDQGGRTTSSERRKQSLLPSRTKKQGQLSDKPLRSPPATGS